MCRILQVRGGHRWKEKVRKAALLLAFRTLLDCKKHKNGGEGGIRTHVPGKGQPDFESGALRPASLPLRFWLCAIMQHKLGRH